MIRSQTARTRLSGPRVPFARAVLLVCLVLGLAACATRSAAPITDRTGQVSTRQDTRAAPPKPRPGVQRPTPPVERQRDERAIAQAGRRMDLPAIAGVEDLIGLTAEALEALLGPPAVRRPEGPAQIWSWEGRGCGLAVVLAQTTAGFAALTVRATPDGSGQTCVIDMPGAP